jgi:hypothetical protein
VNRPLATDLRSGITLLAAAAGSGKTGLAIGIARTLADRGVPVEPFKAVSVIENDDPAYASVPPWQRGILHNCCAARRPIQPWHNPIVVVRTQPGSAVGELFIAAEPAGTVPVPEEDLLNVALLPQRLRRRCRDAVLDAVTEVRAGGRYLVVEGAGAAGELPARDDLANNLAPVLLNCPVALVLNPSRSGHLAAFLGVPGLLTEQVRGLLIGYIANQVRDDAHGEYVEERLAGRTTLERLAVLSEARQPPDYDGSYAYRERIYLRRADQVAGCDLLSRLGAPLRNDLIGEKGGKL